MQGEAKKKLENFLQNLPKNIKASFETLLNYLHKENDIGLQEVCFTNSNEENYNEMLLKNLDTSKIKQYFNEIKTNLQKHKTTNSIIEFYTNYNGSNTTQAFFDTTNNRLFIKLNGEQLVIIDDNRILVTSPEHCVSKNKELSERINNYLQENDFNKVFSQCLFGEITLDKKPQLNIININEKAEEQELNIQNDKHITGHSLEVSSNNNYKIVFSYNMKTNTENNTGYPTMNSEDYNTINTIPDDSPEINQENLIEISNFIQKIEFKNRPILEGSKDGNKICCNRCNFNLSDIWKKISEYLPFCGSSN